MPNVFKYYKFGVYDGQGCDNISVLNVNHAATIVGYDLNATIPYFKMRSSWGKKWGENGYYRIKIGEISSKNMGVCLLAGTPFMVFPHLRNFR